MGSPQVAVGVEVISKFTPGVMVTSVPYLLPGVNTVNALSAWSRK